MKTCTIFYAELKKEKLVTLFFPIHSIPYTKLIVINGKYPIWILFQVYDFENRCDPILVNGKIVISENK